MNMVPCSFTALLLPVFLLSASIYYSRHTDVFCSPSSSPSSSLSHVSASGLVLNLISPALLMYTISSRVHLLSPAIFVIRFRVRDCRLWSAPNFRSTVCSVIYSVFQTPALALLRLTNSSQHFLLLLPFPTVWISDFLAGLLSVDSE